jgi:transposase, IS30 family
MKTNYHHLSIEERDKLAVLRSRSLSLREIAKTLGRSHSSLVRELKRNAPPIRSGYYLAHRAHKRAVERRQIAVHHKRLKTRRLRAYVARQLKRGWSPELIAGRVNRLGWPEHISHEAVYQWVYQDARQYIPFLVRSHRKRQKRGYSRKHMKTHIPQRVPISSRPKSAQARRVAGHWEADTIVSRASRPVLQIVAERKTRYILLNKMPNREAASMRKTLNKAMCKLPTQLRKTITYDNGKENVEHLRVNAVLGTKSFFCAPYTSQEKGTVENRAGLVRRHFPKRTDFAKLNRAKVKSVEHWVNNRPLKCLGFLTPAEAFRQGGALRG